MWKTITKLVQLLGMFLAWTLRMDGSISVMLRFIYWIIFLSHFALYWCNTGVVSAIGVHFTECLQRVSGCSLFSEQWAAGMSIRNLEIWLIHHGTLTFQYFEMEYLIFVYVSRIMHADVLVMVPSVHLIITLSVCFFFFPVYIQRKCREKHFTKLCMSKAAVKHVFIVIVDYI